MKANLLLLGLSSFLALLFLEGAIALCASIGLFQIQVPTYSIDHARSRRFWSDINPAFGVWHLPHHSYRHKQSCFDVTYRSNSHGARDAERTLASPHPRTIVLGDSFIEGWGVEEAQRLTNILERETGIEHLNFGTSVNFGTTQYMLLYETLASKFSHAAVIVGILPANDFWDNDYEYGKQAHPYRYRPYLVADERNYRLVYHRDSIDQSDFRDRPGQLGLAQRILADYTHSYNAFAYFKLLLASRVDSVPTQLKERPNPDAKGALMPIGTSRPYSGFYDYRDDQIQLVKYTLAQIKRISAGREIIIVLLPALADFKRYQPPTPPPLSNELERFAVANGMRFVDLLPPMHAHSNDPESLFLACDGHWNAQGHAVAAQYLRAKLTPLLDQVRSANGRGTASPNH